MNQIVRYRGALPVGGRKLPAHRKRHLLDGGKVILGVGKAESEGHIRVSGSNHMRHAKPVSQDVNIILPSLGNQRGPIRWVRLRHPVRHDQKRSHPGRGAHHHNRTDLQKLHPAHDCLQHSPRSAEDQAVPQPAHRVVA